MLSIHSGNNLALWYVHLWRPRAGDAGTRKGVNFDGLLGGSPG